MVLFNYFFREKIFIVKMSIKGKLFLLIYFVPSPVPREKIWHKTGIHTLIK
jgi:hypothetical protein